MKDFEKEYKEISNVHEKNQYKGQKYVDIVIPRDSSFDYLNSLNETWVSAGSNESVSGLSSMTDQDLTLIEARDKYLKFRSKGIYLFYPSNRFRRCSSNSLINCKII